MTAAPKLNQIILDVEEGGKRGEGDGRRMLEGGKEWEMGGVGGDLLCTRGEGVVGVWVFENTIKFIPHPYIKECLEDLF